MRQTDLLIEKIEYYAARAGDCEDWRFRRGRYDHGAEHTAQWFKEINRVEEALNQFNPRGNVLELACVTEIWSKRLAQTASHSSAWMPINPCWIFTNCKSPNQTSPSNK